MKKVLFLAVALLAAISSFAQTEEGTIVVTPRVGATLCNYNGTFFGPQGSLETANHIGITGGAEIGYQVNKWFLPTVGAMYYNNGTKFNTIDGGNTVSEINSNWISFPFMANFYVLKGLALKVGIQPSLLMCANDKVNKNHMYFDINSLDFQFPVGISYEIGGFILDARYAMGTVRLNRNTYAPATTPTEVYPFEEEFHNHHFTLTLGYKIKFKGPKMPKFPEN